MSEGSKQQLREFIEKAIKNAQNPDMREQIKKQRLKKRTVVAKKYGL